MRAERERLTSKVTDPAGDRAEINRSMNYQAMLKTSGSQRRETTLNSIQMSLMPGMCSQKTLLSSIAFQIPTRPKPCKLTSHWRCYLTSYIKIHYSFMFPNLLFLSDSLDPSGYQG